MKRSSLSVVLSFLLASLAPAAELIVSPETLTPASTLEVRFDTPMVDKARVGTIEKQSPLAGKPEVAGEFKWTSTRSGQFHFTRPPAFATTYKFSLRTGLKDAAGQEVEAEELGEFETEGFRLVSQWREYPYYGQAGVRQRVPRYILQFSDAVDPAAAERAMAFANAGGERVAVAARLATGKDLQGHATPVATWDERVAGTKPSAKADETRPNALVIWTKDPLPVGKNWSLVIPKTFANRAGAAFLEEDKRLMWGHVANLKVVRAEAQPHFDSPHAVEVHFNKSVAAASEPEGDDAHFRQFIKVEPEPPGLKMTALYGGNPVTDEQGVKHRNSGGVSLEGDFALNTSYTVTVSNGVPAADGLGMTEGFSSGKLEFKASSAYVSTSAFQNTQMSTGNGVFDIYAANFKNLRVRVKQLSDGELIRARKLYQDTYNTWDDGKGKNLAKFESAPFEDFPGKVVFDKTWTNQKPLEKATRIDLKWSEVLGQTPAAPVFVEIEGSPQEGAPEGIIFNRSIVEFTDIGLMVKDSGVDTLVYAFSLRTGAPLADTQVTFMDNERGYLGAVPTNDKGIATLNARGAKGWVLAKRGTDCTALDFGNGYGGISLWRHGVHRYAWDSPWKRHIQTFLFSDRPVYKPGDTAHVKAIARFHSGDDFSLGLKPLTGRLTVTDPRGRTIQTKSITFSANGTWSDEVTFPQTLAGWYAVQIAYPKERVGAEESDEVEGGGHASLALRVDDYKPNTFEVALDGAKHQVERDRITVPLRARYYMGKALSQAKTAWSAGLAQNFQPPAAFSEFSFGDVDRWWHYGEERGEETAEEENRPKEWGANGQMELADDGTATIELPLPPPHKEALPQTITVYADVTDVNQQTISASTEFQIPGADFLVGVRKTKWYGNAGQALGFEFTSMTPDGKPFAAPVPVDVRIERQEWNTVRVQSAGGEVTTKNQVTLTEELKTTLQVEGAKGAVKALTPFQFTPKKGGTYFLTATSKDAKGLNIITRVPFYVLGGGGYPWSWEDGEVITLQPDKTRAKPGEEVSIVVKSPISGTALVTVERNRVHRSFLAPITPENPVVKITMTDEDAPNVFVSVAVIRGAADSPQADKMPEYKLGYCEITVPSDARKLAVEARASQATVRPGDELTVAATVRDAAGRPVAGSEVALYAVDEGVLSLMSYETPVPFDFFHTAAALAVKTYTTLGSLLAEDLDKRDRGNKGIIVGGGGDEGGADAALRKNFVATATWNAALITGDDGRVSATFKVPDSLTRYRIMAVAVKDADRYGTGESAFTVNKPLMLEPAVPRFAHVGDEILVKAVLHNTTAFSGEVEVELKLNERATLVTEERPYALVALMKNRTMTNDGKLDRRVVTLKAGETTALAFPVRFVKSGACAWQWRVHTVKWSDAKALADAVESRFEVTQPAPALREVRYFELTHAKGADNLLKGINPQLLESDGTLRLEVNRSRLGEARDALEHLLHYPYGCVEQTTSSTLPWLALANYGPMFPDLLEKDKVRTAILRGAERLLAMQTEQGGLSYWPGGDKPLLWASAYGGFGLVKAKEWGAPVPQEAIDSLTAWMSKNLRELDLAATRHTYDLTDAALALYTLAKAGKPEPSYQTMLYQRRDDLPEMARLFLGLSMCLTKAPEKQITELLKQPKSNTRWERYWLGDHTPAGLRMIICAHLGLTDEGSKYAGEVLSRRNGLGHWGTTFSNSWILLGLVAGEKAPKDVKPLDLQVAWGDQSNDLKLANAMSTASSVFEFDHKLGAKTLKATVPEGQSVRGRVELKAWPDLKTFQAVQKGFGIARRYQRLTPSGALEEPKNLRVGDLIVVTLDIKVLKGNRYLAIEDPLPSVFEPVNPEFATQNQRQDAKAQDNAWFCDHRELRNDKALFFTDDWSRLGNFELKYLARVIAEGDVIAPPARIEAMYQPDQYGLSDIIRVQTLPMTNSGNVAEK